jgi:CubicO group peptidase (beta-lactamase class C family)
VNDDLELIDGLREFVPEAMRVTQTPGLNLALARDGQLIWEAAFGSADLASQTSMRTDTVVCAGSMAKTYVAVAALQLVDAGILDLHAPLESWLPDVAICNPLGERPVTAYDLLTYRSGLATDTGDCLLAPHGPLESWLRNELARDRQPEYRSGRSRWTAKVGERFQYSSLGMAVVGLLVERMNPDGLTFSAYVRRSIIDALGLTSTDLPCSFRPTDVRPAVRERLATGYARCGPALVPVPLLHSGAYPAITLLTTPSDEARLLELLMGDGVIDGKRILSAHAVRLMRSAHVATHRDVPGPAGHYGLGLQLKRPGERTSSFGHGGTHPFGWWSEAHAYPALGMTAVVCSNKRNVMGWYNPEHETAPGLVHGYIVDRLCESASRKRARVRSWGWKASYVVGIVMVERLLGTLGQRDALGDQAIEAMAMNARPGESGWEWDEGAFRQGVADMLEVEPTAAGIRSFLTGPALRIHPAELELMWLELGGRGKPSVPIGFWADGAR